VAGEPDERIYLSIVEQSPTTVVITDPLGNITRYSYDADGQLLRHAHRIRAIPGVIVQGRYDVVCPMESAWDLHRAWPEADLNVVPDAGHSAFEPPISRELVAATERVRAGDLRVRIGAVGGSGEFSQLAASFDEMIAALEGETVLFVCTGNSCRSPMAEGLLRQAARGRGDYRVLSAGLGAVEGQPPSPYAIQAIKELGVDISGLRSRMLTPALVQQADYIFGMTHIHIDTVMLLYPQAAE
jgi:YD repeat-containing protein